MTALTSERSAHSRAGLWLFAVAGCLLAGAAAAHVAAGRLISEAPAYVHVRWTVPLDESARHELERRFSLTRPEPRDGSTYGYFLTDLSADNIRRLVIDPAVADTHEIDRSAFRISPTAERLTSANPRAGRLAPILRRASTVQTVLGITGLALAVLSLLAPAATSRWWRAVSRQVPAAIARWVSGQVPEVAPEAVALFRMLFGAGMVVFLTFYSPVNPGGVIAGWVTPWLAVWGALFVAGAFTRVSFAALALGAVVWAVLSDAGSHPVAPLLFTCVCLLPSRWADAWSVDAWWGRRRGHAVARGTPKDYGYTVWIPGLLMAVLFAAAAVAKLRNSGFDWIANGTVKYHFLTDSSQAPLDWGLRLGPYDAMAVVISLGAVAIEALLLPALLSRRYWLSATAGVAAATLLAGFYLFQGVFWPAWWLLLLGFLPWHRVGGAPRQQAAARGFALRPIHMTLICVVVVQQMVASAFTLEVQPMLSVYDMYSTTYASRQAYEVATSRGYRLVGLRDDQSATACEVTSNEAAAIADALAENAGIDGILERCFAGTAPIRSVTVEVSRTVVDWDRWRLLGEQQIILAGPSSVAHR